MTEWRNSRWGDEITLEYGKSLKGYADGTGPVRVYGSNGAVGWTDKPLAPGPGVILGRKGAYRGVRFSPDPFFVIDTAYYARPKTQLDMRWLYYAMIHYKLGEIDDGSPIPSTTRSAVYVRELDVPSFGEQRRIAGVLAAFDEKIELNQRMNETLVSMARVIFRDWFVDFGPTRAKLVGAAPYLTPRLWDLFPENLDEERKPESWSTSTVGDEVTVVGGSTPSTKDPTFWDGSINWATPKDLSRLEAPVLLTTERTITETGLSQISSGLLPEGTVLLSSRAPIGYLAIAMTPCAINQGFIAMRCEQRISNIFAWLWAGQNLDMILQHANGSTFQEISKRNFRPLSMIVPSDDVLAAFDEIVGPIFDRVVANERETHALARTRDALLPKLMSGEIRLREAERVLETV